MSKLFNLTLFVLTFSIMVNCQPNSKNKTQNNALKNVTANLKPDSSQMDMQRFEEEIQNFESLDAVNGYMEGGVLFTGSSSIRLWSTLQQDMSGFKILNRGFGGSTIPEVIKYAPRYLWKHKPDVIVFYCGENDIGDGVTPEVVYKNFVEFTRLVEGKLPGTKMVYISMKPSIARWEYWQQFQAGDQLIKEFINEKMAIEFMDSGSSMMAENGVVRQDIFIEDGLHMNAEGYKEWTLMLLPILKKLYNQ